jgi:hypothetical protein
MIKSTFLLLTTTLGLVTSVPAQKQEKIPSSIPTVGFCELTTHPEKYVDKLVRTEANYIVWWESSYLYGDNCIDDGHKVHNGWDCSADDTDCQKRFSIQWKKLEPYMRSKQSRIQSTSRVKAVFIGRLVGPGSCGHLDGFRYEFRITKVERAIAIPRGVSWEGL